MTEIEHITDEGSHGPVAIFLSDDGRVGFVCRQDGAYWEGDMPQLAPPTTAQPGRDVPIGSTDRLVEDEVGERVGRRSAWNPDLDTEARLVSMDEARQVARERMRR